MSDLNISFLFSSPNVFPWEYAGFDYPVFGSSYSYLCKHLAAFEPEQEGFLQGNPSLHELQRCGQENGGLSKEIYEYVQKIRQNQSIFPKSMQQEILDFLKEFHPYRTALAKRIESDYKRGRISLPEGCF